MLLKFNKTIVVLKYKPKIPPLLHRSDFLQLAAIQMHYYSQADSRSSQSVFAGAELLSCSSRLLRCPACVHSLLTLSSGSVRNAPRHGTPA